MHVKFYDKITAEKIISKCSAKGCLVDKQIQHFLIIPAEE
jgi:hypothetical protein